MAIIRGDYSKLLFMAIIRGHNSWLLFEAIIREAQGTRYRVRGRGHDAGEARGARSLEAIIRGYYSRLLFEAAGH